MKNSALIHLIGACVFLVAVLGGYAFWYSLIAAKSTEASSLAEQIDEQKQSSSRVAVAKAELASLATQESTVDQYFVATSDVVPFLEQIQTIGNYLGATVSVDSVAANPGVPFGNLTLSLTIKGSFDAVMRTIGAIEYEPYDTSVTSLNVSQAPTQNQTASSTQWVGSAIFSVGAQTATTTP